MSLGHILDIGRTNGERHAIQPPLPQPAPAYAQPSSPPRLRARTLRSLSELCSRRRRGIFISGGVGQHIPGLTLEREVLALAPLGLTHTLSEARSHLMVYARSPRGRSPVHPSALGTCPQACDPCIRRRLPVIMTNMVPPVWQPHTPSRIWSRSSRIWPPPPCLLARPTHPTGQLAISTPSPTTPHCSLARSPEHPSDSIP
jgi:hypothetical protein